MRRNRYLYDWQDYAKEALGWVGLVLLICLMLPVAGFVLGLAWRAFTFGWNLL